MGCVVSSSTNGFKVTKSFWHSPMNNHRVDQIFLEVFENLQVPMVIADLSLPPLQHLKGSIEQCKSRISIQFLETPPNSRLPLSITTTIDGTKSCSIEIYYYRFEIQERPQIIEARVLHEATHALRAQMIFWCERAQVDRSLLSISTPGKEIYQYRGKMFLEQDSFRSGYYMEHHVNGGVWISLDKNGILYDEDTGRFQMITDWKGLLFFVIRKEECISLDYEELPKNFHRLVGNYTGDRNLLNSISILFHGRMTTRSEDDGCIRSMQ
jgi:hypothetical protein